MKTKYLPFYWSRDAPFFIILNISPTPNQKKGC